MKPLRPEDPETKSADVLAENVEALKALFPEAFTEGRIDFAVLKQLLGGALEEREEKYGLSWHGKRQARQLALTPSTGTLRPCPEESVDWDTTQNLMIEGDNLEVLKLLQKSYAGKVKLIYIDPPYNTGKDFVYPDNFRDSIQNYLELTGQVEGGRSVSSHTDSSGRFHTDWLNMVYPRLKLARNLLRPDGVIAISIDDGELANLRSLCDEVFGQECFAGCVARATGTPTGGGNRALVNEIDFVLVYLRTPDTPIEGVAFSEEDAEIYDKKDENGRYLIRSLRRTGGEDRREDRPSMYYALTAPDGTQVFPIAPAGYESRWICGQARYRELEQEGLIEWSRTEREAGASWQVYQKFYLEGRLKQPSNLWVDLEGNKKASRDLKALFDGQKVFTFPKPVGLLRHVIQLAASDKSAMVIDFFAGSGTTGHAVLEQNASDGGGRRFALVQLPEPLDREVREQREAAEFCEKNGLAGNIAALTEERLRRAARKIKEENPLFSGDLGFRVFKLDSTNIRPWDPDRENLERSLDEAVEHIKPDRLEADVLVELFLKLGLDLTLPIDKKEIAGKMVHSVGAGELIVCLAKEIASAEAESLAVGIAEWHKALRPWDGGEDKARKSEATIVFRDSAFADDVAKTNLTAILEQHGLVNVRSL